MAVLGWSKAPVYWIRIPSCFAHHNDLNLLGKFILCLAILIFRIQVSKELKSLGKSKGSNATEFNDLATQVEDFAYHLLEPLKNDDKKRDTFKEKLFDRVSDNALKYRQKKVWFTRYMDEQVGAGEAKGNTDYEL